MRYIVTGGAGFIGSNLADRLAQNHDVVIIDNLPKPCSPDSGLLPRGC
jgi:nucleoside-diphosphate-sugar epimerase